MHDRCKKIVRDIVERMEKGEFRSETDVRRGIVDPLLQTLGWPVSRPRVVEREYHVEDGRVDYALCPKGKPLVFIEAKRPGSVTDAGRKQLFRYCTMHGVPMAVLTDGREWHFYLLLRRGTADERRLPPIDLSSDTTEACTKLRRYLEYRAVTSEKNIESATRDLEQVRFERACESVWRELVEAPFPEFRKMFAERVWRRVPRRAGDDVAEWIRKRARLQPPLPPPGPAPVDPPPDPPQPPGQPRGYRLWGGDVQPAGSWRDVLRGVADDLYHRHEDDFVEALEWPWPWVTEYPGERNTPYRMGKSRYFIELNVSASDILKRCRRLLEFFGHEGLDLDIVD